MAQRRMFSPQIVCSEEFLTMPVSSRELYFQLGMQADDDGFIQPKLIMKLTGAGDDDLKVLLAKRFLLAFDGGVVVIKHWLIHNLIQKDRYHPTRFQDEKKLLFIKENKAYTENDVSVNKMLTEVRLGKVKEDKRESSLNFLKEISKEEIQEFTLKFKCEDANVKTKANALYDYCKAKGRVYKNYKSFLSNALRKDFGERPPKQKIPNYEVENGVAVFKGYK
jgi:hypothetical protein